MARINDLYPPTPRNVPDDLTEPSSDYQTRMLLVLFSLLTFFGLYLFLLCSSALLIPLSLVLVPIPLNLIFCFFFVLAFLFLVKGFFKSRAEEKTFRVEITEEEHPRLFAFIGRLCEETGAPLPHRVFLSPDVNAFVFYNESILSLFLPTPKNLLIGLGLVNILTLSEFKAVLAHEFGHFSQKSMKLHQYVYTASQIIGDMVFGRDWFDRTVLAMRDSGTRLAVLGWVCWSVLWVFRKLLEGCFYGINFLGLSLSRQMEFNADLVAVSVAGSDAIVHALSRLGFGAESLGLAFAELRIASQHDLFTADIFYHHNHAAAYLRRVRKDPHLGEPPALPDDPECSPEVFEEDDDSASKMQMWSTHPSCYDREQNAKEVYIRAEMDDRSPWLLFEDPQELRERITRKFYRLVVGLPREVDLDDPRAVQQFIDDEHAETTYDERYHGAYDGRFITPGDLGDLQRSVREQPWKAEVLARMFPRLYGDELKARMKEHWRLREELEQLSAVKNGQRGDEDTFKFRGRRYETDEAGRLLKQVSRELDEDSDWLGELDKRVFRVHYQMAQELGKKTAEELLYRYRFHLAVQSIDRELQPPMRALDSALGYVSRVGRQLTYEEFAELRSVFRDCHDALVRCVTLADKMRLPRLKNMKEGEPLGHFLLEQQIVKALRPTAKSLTPKWMTKLIGQVQEVQSRIRRIHFKSLGALLALQEEIGKRWMAELASVPSVELAEEPAAALAAKGPAKAAKAGPPEPKIKVVRTWAPKKE